MQEGFKRWTTSPLFYVSAGGVVLGAILDSDALMTYAGVGAIVAPFAEGPLELAGFFLETLTDAVKSVIGIAEDIGGIGGDILEGAGGVVSDAGGFVSDTVSDIGGLLGI